MPFQGTDSEVLARLCAMAAEQVAMDPTLVQPDSDFSADLNFDSLDSVEFVMKIEDEFGVSIEDEQAEKVRTPRQAYELLTKARAT